MVPQPHSYQFLCVLWAFLPAGIITMPNSADYCCVPYLSDTRAALDSLIRCRRETNLSHEDYCGLIHAWQIPPLDNMTCSIRCGRLSFSVKGGSDSQLSCLLPDLSDKGSHSSRQLPAESSKQLGTGKQHLCFLGSGLTLQVNSYSSVIMIDSS